MIQQRLYTSPSPIVSMMTKCKICSKNPASSLKPRMIFHMAAQTTNLGTRVGAKQQVPVLLLAPQYSKLSMLSNLLCTGSLDRSGLL